MRGFFSAEEFDVGGLAVCHKCNLHKRCQSPKIKPRSSRNGILLVGEIPGKASDENNLPIAGERRKILSKLLNDCGLDLDDCGYTNAIICHPEKNPAPDAFEYCRPNLLKTIEEQKPRVIIPMGWLAFSSLMVPEVVAFGGPMKIWLGWNIPTHRYGAWVCPVESLVHQNFEVQEVLFKKMIHRAMARVDEPLPKGYTEAELRGLVDVVLDENEAQAGLEDLSQQSGILAFDYEATGLKPEAPDHRIVTCSFCLEPGDRAWACRITPRLMEPLSAVLRSKSLLKVASNLKYEERWTWEMFGHGVRSWFWDTMLAAHFLDNRGYISSVKFQALVRYGVLPWTTVVDRYLTAETPNGHNQVESAPIRELLIYNAIDSLLEYKVMENQRCEMGLE